MKKALYIPQLTQPVNALNFLGDERHIFADLSAAQASFGFSKATPRLMLFSLLRIGRYTLPKFFILSRQP